MNADQQIHLDALITAFGDAGFDCGEVDLDEAGCEDLYRQKHAKYERARAALRLYAIDPTNHPTDEQIALEIERNTGIKPA